LIKSRVIILSIFIFLFLCGCVQNLHKNPVSPEETFFSNRESSPDPATMSDNVASDISSPTDAFDLSELPEKVGTEDQNSSLAVPDSQNHESKDSDQGEKIQSVLDEALDFCQASQDFWQKGELENALEALDHAYALILKTDTTNSPKLIQQKEDLRFMISKRILEIYASRNIVVNGNHNAIPLVMNKHVQLEINHFTKYGEKSFFIKAYKRSGKYRPYIVSELKAAGIPVELSWLPLIESGFKVNALSRARALGPWQFIPSTGYKFGLKRNKYIDERIDPVKSTQAAIAYLKELHQIFGDWSTVLAAYNCGEGRVLRVIRSQNINYLDNFWDLYERLPRETARYVPRFMAALFIINNPEKYGLNAITVDEPLKYENVTVSKQIHLKNIAREIGVAEKTLRELNPELRYRILPQDNYPLRVPPGKSEVLLANLDKIPVSYPPQPAYVYHRIRPGESLSTIARRYRSSVRKIMRANNLHRSSYIVAGKKLKIPRRGTIPYTPKIDRNKDVTIPSAHVVKSGDSLWNIAKRYGTTTKKIQSLNELQTTQLHIGQVLKIPGYKDEKIVNKIEVGNLKVYQVKRGDSPFDIAQLHNMPLKRFLRINLLTLKSTIYPGQKLYIE
jgi:peptidoglycan lytic transglycosylase D